MWAARMCSSCASHRVELWHKRGQLLQKATERLAVTTQCLAWVYRHLRECTIIRTTSHNTLRYPSIAHRSHWFHSYLLMTYTWHMTNTSNTCHISVHGELVQYRIFMERLVVVAIVCGYANCRDVYSGATSESSGLVMTTSEHVPAHRGFVFVDGKEKREISLPI